MKRCTRKLVEAAWQHYRTAGRHSLPWRRQQNPYRILVSEMMLQQTPVVRVIPKYQAFIQEFPTVMKLASAPLSRVLQLWQGLGYNRRAKYLHATAQVVVRKHRGIFPRNELVLRSLPGIGSYTAAAIIVFAYNQPTVLIETNIRAVFLHHCFPGSDSVPDDLLIPYIRTTVPAEAVRDWYAALMDYGSYLKRRHGNISRRSRTYTKQAPFVGSDRQIRGAIIRYLTTQAHTWVTFSSIQRVLRREGMSQARVAIQLAALVSEGLVWQQGRRVTLPT